MNGKQKTKLFYSFRLNPYNLYFQIMHIFVLASELIIKKKKKTRLLLTRKESEILIAFQLAERLLHASI